MFILLIKHPNPQYRSFRFPYRIIRQGFSCRPPAPNTPIQLFEDDGPDSTFLPVQRLNMVLQFITEYIDDIEVQRYEIHIKLNELDRVERERAWHAIHVAITRAFCMDIRSF